MALVEASWRPDAGVSRLVAAVGELYADRGFPQKASKAAEIAGSFAGAERMLLEGLEHKHQCRGFFLARGIDFTDADSIAAAVAPPAAPVDPAALAQAAVVDAVRALYQAQKLPAKAEQAEQIVEQFAVAGPQFQATLLQGLEQRYQQPGFFESRGVALASSASSAHDSVLVAGAPLGLPEPPPREGN